MEPLLLADARSRVEIVPDLGGGIASMDALLAGGRTVPVLRPWTGDPNDGPFALASNILVPFSNRISGGGLHYDEAFHLVPANLEGEPFPIHGDGFQRIWKTHEASDRTVDLSLPAGAIGPFRYAATARYMLRDRCLTSALSLSNTGPVSLPFGAGFHPWFPRTPTTRLAFEAEQVWLEDDRYLPTELVPVSSRPAWDFAGGRSLPRGWINNAFVGWRRKARIEQPDLGIAVTIEASPRLETAIVYSPEAEASFFCFEPVTHAVDAHNRPDLTGLVVLAPGEAVTVEMSIRWDGF